MWYKLKISLKPNAFLYGILSVVLLANNIKDKQAKLCVLNIPKAKDLIDSRATKALKDGDEVIENVYLMYKKCWSKVAANGGE